MLIEKPAAINSAEAVELTKLAAERGRKLQVGAMRRHDPALRDAQQAVAGIGPILSASFWYRLPSVLRGSTEAALFPPVVVDEEVRSTEAEHKADRETYLLRTHGAHLFDSVRYLLGDATALRAELARQWRGSALAGIDRDRGYFGSRVLDYRECALRVRGGCRDIRRAAGTSGFARTFRSTAALAAFGSLTNTTSNGAAPSTARSIPISGSSPPSLPRLPRTATPTRAVPTALRRCS